MKTYLKQAPPPAPQDRTRLEETVRKMLADIEANRDEAVKRYARARPVGERGVPGARSTRSARSRATCPNRSRDFEYSLAQVVGFAKRQLDTLKSFETELEPGIVLGQKMIPVERVGCYVPGGKFPLVASAIMSARRPRGSRTSSARPTCARTACIRTRSTPSTAAGADEIYELGGVQAMAAMAYGCVGIAPVDMITGARQRLCSRGEAPALRPRRHRPAGRPDRDPGDRRRLAPIPRWSRPTSSARPSTARTARPGWSPRPSARRGRF